MAEPGDKDKAEDASAGEIPYKQFIVPALLITGWIVGCAMMVYVIFS
ncbi:sarcoplasmic/endoplasmic reticulum calcium ATPase regulator DWORF [Pleurodeles waltl]